MTRAPHRPAVPARHGPSDAGFSLVEVLLTLMMMALVFTAILSGISASIGVTKTNERLAEGDRMMREMVEKLKDSDIGSTYAYIPCARASGGTAAQRYAPYTPPAPQQDWRVEITQIEYPTATYTGWTSSCTVTGGLDRGAQRITVRIRPPATVGEEPDQTVVVIKRDTRGET